MSVIFAKSVTVEEVILCKPLVATCAEDEDLLPMILFTDGI